VDKLPGGLEAENPVLKTSRPTADKDEGGDKGKEKGTEPTKPATWFEHVR